MSLVSAKSLIIGSRGSQLALWQARHIAAKLEEQGFQTRIEIIRTTGDRLQTASPEQTGGKGLFTKEIEEALLGREIDLAVHSLKDLPTQITQGLTIAAIPEREDPRDALVGSRLNELRRGARVGTSSGRRGAQLRAIRPDVLIEPIRGNVDTRLRKLRERQYDAVLLAAAGLRRLGLEGEISQLLSPDEICPAAGQGALAIETRVGDEAFEITRRLNHEPSRRAVVCERAALAALGGGCQLPIGAYASCTGANLSVQAIVVAPDGSKCLRATETGNAEDPEALGRAVAQDLIARGASEIIAQSQ